MARVFIIKHLLLPYANKIIGRHFYYEVIRRRVAKSPVHCIMYKKHKNTQISTEHKAWPLGYNAKEWLSPKKLNPFPDDERHQQNWNTWPLFPLLWICDTAFTLSWQKVAENTIVHVRLELTPDLSQQCIVLALFLMPHPFFLLAKANKTNQINGFDSVQWSFEKIWTGHWTISHSIITHE